jgi:hypothetical protein
MVKGEKPGDLPVQQTVKFAECVARKCGSHRSRSAASQVGWRSRRRDRCFRARRGPVPARRASQVRQGCQHPLGDHFVETEPGGRGVPVRRDARDEARLWLRESRARPARGTLSVIAGALRAVARELDPPPTGVEEFARALLQVSSCRRCPYWTADGYRSDTQGLPPRYADRGSADESWH